MKKKEKNTYYSQYSTYIPQPKFWENDVKREYVSTCGNVVPPRVEMSILAIKKIIKLLKIYPHKEWAVDLLGEYRENENIYIVNDLYIFKQTVSVTSVTREEGPPLGAIGVLHSHHSMGDFFSTTDDTYPNQNHSLSGVVSSTPNGLLPFSIKFNITTKTPCGKYTNTTVSNVTLLLDNDGDVDIDVTKIKDNSFSFYTSHYIKEGFK